MKYRVKMRVAVIFSMLLGIFIVCASCSKTTQTIAVGGCVDPYSNTNITGNYIGSWHGSGLNDTGIMQWGNDDNNYYKTSLSVEVLRSVWRNQDMDNGRDAYADLCKIGAGIEGTGLDYTKLDLSGNKLHDSARNWACVLDNHTGLVWYNKAYPVYQQYSNPTKYQVVQTLYGPGPGGYQTAVADGGGSETRVPQNSGYSYAADDDSKTGTYLNPIIEDSYPAQGPSTTNSILWRYRTDEKIVQNNNGATKTVFYDEEKSPSNEDLKVNGNCGIDNWDIPTVNQLLSLRVLDNIHAIDYTYFPAYQIIYEPINPHLYDPTEITNYTEDANTRCKAALQSQNITSTTDSALINETILSATDTAFAYCRRVIKRIAWTQEKCLVDGAVDKYWVIDLYTGGLQCKDQTSKVMLFYGDQSGWRMIYQLVAVPKFDNDTEYNNITLKSIWDSTAQYYIY
jgi:hypothetical protein